MKNIIQINNLSKHFGDVIALENINLQVNQGDFISIIGPSGSGKTTLLNILALMDDFTSGTYLLDNQNTANMHEEQKMIFRREKIGLIFQQFHLIPYLNALENVMLAQYYHSVVDEAQAKKMLDIVGLSHRYTHLPSQLSGGEQQRVCIARALVNEPELLLADEPTGNLDEKNELLVLDLLKQLNKEGKTIILITHNLELAKQTDKVVEIRHGKLNTQAGI